MLGNYRVAAQLVASRAVLSSTVRLVIAGCSAVEKTCRPPIDTSNKHTINATYCSGKIRLPDGARLSPLMTDSAVGSYSSNLREMLCPLHAAGKFPLTLNALNNAVCRLYERNFV
jgi:hypothetical protein